jgi:hypothetical protein
MLNLGHDSARAVEKLKGQNINLWPEQDKQPVMPRDISDLESDDLSELFTRLTAWSNFVAGQLSASQIDEKSIEKRRDMLEARLLIMKDNVKLKGERVTMIKAQVMSDPTFMELEEKYMEAYAYRKMLEVIYNNFERDVSLVSREITRRTNDIRVNRKDKFSS